MYSKAGASPSVGARNRTRDDVNPISGLCGVCLESCTGLWEVGRYAINGTENYRIVAKKDSNTESGFMFTVEIRRGYGEWNPLDETGSRWLVDKWKEKWKMVDNPEAEKFLGK